MAETVCIEIPELPDPQQLILPGGVAIEHLRLVEIIQPALTPLMPLFEIVDAVVAVFHCIQAIPDALGPPPDPTVLAACVPELGAKVSKLLKLVPQLSLPMTIVGLIDLVMDALRQARSELVYLQVQMHQTARAVERAAELDDAELAAIATCTRKNVAREAANVGKQLGALGKLMGLLALFLGMIGGPEIPDLSSLSGVPLDGILEPLDALLSHLQAVRAAVPVP
jgi:hypothetical protein